MIVTRRKRRGSQQRTILTFSGVLLSIVTLFLLFVFLSSLAEGKTITVDDDGEADFSTIQRAFYSAFNGDTIRVWEGTYYENVVVDKRIDLIGNGSQVTTINANGTGDVVKITSDYVNMSGFSLTGSGFPNAGIRIESNSTMIINNTIKNNNYYGISLENSNDCIILNNICENNTKSSIALRDSGDCVLLNNICKNITFGMLITSSNNTMIANNILNSTKKECISLIRSSNCTIINNTMNEKGIDIISESLEHWNSHTIETTNTVNGKPVYFYNDISGITVTLGAGQVILANCSNSIVEYQNISNTRRGIMVGYSSNIALENNTYSSNEYYGIYIIESSKCIVKNNNCFNNKGSGIRLTESSECIVTNNNCFNNSGSGISLYSSNDCTLANNTMENNWGGIYLDGSRDCTIMNNVCSSNSDSGIYLRGSNNNTIENNRLSGNSVGILVKRDSRYNSAHDNSILRNSEYGIDASTNNKCAINATNNWWGDESGPYHPTENPDGKGDQVTEYVEFDPSIGKEEGEEKKKDENDDEELDLLPLLVISGILSSGLIGLGLSRESIRLSILTIGAVPLYSKLKRDHILDQSNRSEIYSTILTNPGVNYTQLKRSLPLGTGTLLHHLAVLEREGWIRSMKLSGKRIYQPKNGGRNGRFVNTPIPPSPHQKTILSFLKMNGPASLKDLELQCGLKQTTVSHNVKQLVTRGLVQGSGEKRNAKFWIVKET